MSAAGTASTGFDRRRLRTVHLVPLTAFAARGNLNTDLQGEHARRLYRAGVRVFMPAAGTGEFHSLSADEIVEVIRVTRAATGPDAVIFAPVGYQGGQARDVGQRALEAGADGVMFMPLVHPYLCDAGARDYYQEVLSTLACPALIYKRGAVPSDRLLLELAGGPQVIGIKYAENALHEFRKTVLADGGRIEWLCGTAERFAPYYILAGATGYTSGAGNLCPHLTLAMQAAFAQGEFVEGMRFQQALLPIEEYRERAGESYNISLLKAAMQIFFQEDWGIPRAPQRRIAASEWQEIETALRPALDAEQALLREADQAGFRN